MKNYYLVLTGAHLYRNDKHPQVMVTLRKRKEGLGPRRHSQELAIHLQCLFFKLAGEITGVYYFLHFGVCLKCFRSCKKSPHNGCL